MSTTDTPVALQSGRGVITLGFGKEKYRRMAAALGRSVAIASPGMARAVVTDQPDDPLLIDSFDTIIAYEPSYGSGLEQKLALDLYTPYEHTLFIDADSLVVRDLSRVFDLMGVVPFGVVGFPIVDGFYWGEVSDWLDRFDVAYLGKFNAGLMCFRDDAGAAVFRSARKFISDGVIEGVPIYRGALLDEIFLAGAMAKNDLIPIYDDGTVMRAPEPLESRFIIDARNGVGRFKTKGKWVEPAVVHFAYLYHGSGTRGSVYRREIQRLLGEETSVGENIRCAAAQTMFTLEGSKTVRDAWKHSRGTLRRTLRR